jgi:zinc protease
MKSILIIGLTLIISSSLFASNIKDRIKKYDWNGIEVVWLEDDRFPTYDIIFYFADGALSDGNYLKGETSSMFSMLGNGTRRFSQKDLSDHLEYFGVSYSPYITHEYSLYSVSGLAKDVVPTMKMICHMFKDATFPINEIKKEKKLWRNKLQNLVNNQGALAGRVFRELSLKGSPYNYPVGGKLSDIRKINQAGLSKKKDYFNNKVKKRIYITGPKKILDIKQTISHDCEWKAEENQIVRTMNYKPVKEKTKPEIFLITVPKSNQAQVRIGRFLNKGEFDSPATINLSTGFLGGGFTSKLMREVRVKRGLTYSIGAFAAGQREYGRSGISTFTPNEKINDLLKVINETLEGAIRGEITNEELERARGYLLGSHPFQFEESSSFLQQLVIMDHENRSYDDLFEFTEKVSKVNKGQVVKMIDQYFNWKKQTIVILGSKKLAKDLKKSGIKVKIVDYKKFL